MCIIIKLNNNFFQSRKRKAKDDENAAKRAKTLVSVCINTSPTLTKIESQMRCRLTVDGVVVDMETVAVVATAKSLI